MLNKVLLNGTLWVYNKWIENNKKEIKNKCHQTCIEMQTEFPELELKRGYFLCDMTGNREHWWLETTVYNTRVIIDPTVKQFPTKIPNIHKLYSYYVEYTGPEPIGRCIECGNLIFDDVTYYSSNFCNKYCELSALSALGV